jgi:hypothetical protein
MPEGLRQLFLQKWFRCPFRIFHHRFGDGKNFAAEEFSLSRYNFKLKIPRGDFRVL